jgi:hypothetical protein
MKADSPNDGILFSAEVIIASTNVDPDLGKPIINIGEMSFNK